MKSIEKSRMQNFKTPGKILITKTWLNFWGVTILPPLRKISSSRFAKDCFEKKYYYQVKMITYLSGKMGLQ